jgi:hypothetical protein
LTIGATPAGYGEYYFNGGTLVALTLNVGDQGLGNFHQRTSLTTINVNIANGPQAVGTYSVDSGTLSAITLNVGVAGAGAVVQVANTAVEASELILGAQSSGQGTYTLPANATLTITGSLDGTEIIGQAGIGVFNQTGGTHLNLQSQQGDTSSITIGASNGANGQYNLSGGTLGTITEFIGFSSGTGTFNQTGGTNSLVMANAAGALYVGNGIEAHGTYNLSGSGSVLRANLEIVGLFGGIGTFVQTGGLNSIQDDNFDTGTLYVAKNGFGSSYQLSGTGQLVATEQYIGAGGTGEFRQLGGTNTTGLLSVGPNGYATGGNGTYTLSAGSLHVMTELIGGGVAFESGAGTMTHSGGTNAVTTLVLNGNSFYGLSGSGALTASTEAVHLNGQFQQTGGTNTLQGANARLSIDGSYTLSAGTLSASSPGAAATYGTSVTGGFSQGGGTVGTGIFENQGSFDYTGGAFNGKLQNDGVVQITGQFNAGGGVVNNTEIDVSSSNSLFGGGAGLDNEGILGLMGGTVGGAGTVNNGLISGFGTINGTNFTNNGLLTESGGILTLAATGTNQNFGNINLTAGLQMRLTGSKLTNAGTVSLNGGIVAGSATLENAAGGVISGAGTISAAFLNDLGATVQVASGTLNVAQAFTNNGLVSLNGASANLSGGALTNNGTIQGVGNVGSGTVTNHGTIEAFGGTLNVAGSVSNATDGQIFAGPGAKVLASGGVSQNGGLINLTGGTFDNGNHPLTNAGQISGYGTFRTGGLSNVTGGSVTFSGGVTTVNGDVTNGAGTGSGAGAVVTDGTGTVHVAQSPAVFTGNVVNWGTFKVTNTTVTYAGSFTNNGVLISDPSTQNFSDLVVGAGGAIVAAAGDVYNVTGNVTNFSTQNSIFDMSEAKLVLQGIGTHQFLWPGANGGSNGAGFADNFSIGILEIQSGGSLNILDGDSTPGIGLYVHTLLLDGGAAQLGSITSNGASIYYDPTEPANAYLNGSTYTLANGEVIAPAVPAPEPSACTLVLFSAVVGGVRRRHRR